MKVNELLEKIAVERPVGTANNESILEFVEEVSEKLGYQLQALPFQCKVWNDCGSELNGCTVDLLTSPFSPSFSGTAELIAADSLDQLDQRIADKIVLLHGDLTKDGIQPKDYPFYYPEEHKALIEAMEINRPKAILAATGKSQMSGWDPFPLFSDGNFMLPSAYFKEDAFSLVKQLSERRQLQLTISSQNELVESRQLIAQKPGKTKEKVIICAHMDTQYNTPGTLDNATGLAVLIQLMNLCKSEDFDFALDFVPFNTEEYYGADGELGYLAELANSEEQVKLVINIDSPAHIGSKTAISTYNVAGDLADTLENQMSQHPEIVTGEPWFAGDHAVFAFQQIPCLAVSSCDLFEGALANTHTPADTLDTVDPAIIDTAAAFLYQMLKSI